MMPNFAKAMRKVTIPAYNGANTSGPNGSNATVVQLAAANPDRRSFRVINTGTGLAHYGYTPALAPGNGWPLTEAAGAGQAGGRDEDTIPHVGAIYAVSTAGTDLMVIDG